MVLFRAHHSSYILNGWENGQTKGKEISFWGYVLWGVKKHDFTVPELSIEILCIRMQVCSSNLGLIWFAFVWKSHCSRVTVLLSCRIVRIRSQPAPIPSQDTFSWGKFKFNIQWQPQSGCCIGLDYVGARLSCRKMENLIFTYHLFLTITYVIILQPESYHFFCFLKC